MGRQAVLLAVRVGRPDRRQKKVGDYWCGWCRKYFTVKTETPLERTHLEIRKWIFAAYLLMTSRKGISAMQLGKEVDVSYPTSWYMLHRLRLACGNDMETLYGTVEIDECYLGGKEENKHEHKKLKAGRGAVGKQAVLGMRVRGGKIVAMPVPNTEKETIQNAVHKHVRPGSTICTDDNPSYNGVAHRHRTVNHSA